MKSNETAQVQAVPDSALPRHVAIIMDGNGRWAQARGMERTKGHRAGVETVRSIVTFCRQKGIRHLTLYAFSSENWNRPKAEVSTLFSLLVEFLGQEMPRMLREGIALKVFGNTDALPLAAKTALALAVKTTAKGRDMTLNLALNYGAREEIVRAAQMLVESGIRAKDITEDVFAGYLYSAGQPDPDFVIRTSGEVRLSNFLLYQLAYAELYFTSTTWPDFTTACMEEALAEYTRRQRRFGRTQEQVDAEKVSLREMNK